MTKIDVSSHLTCFQVDYPTPFISGLRKIPTFAELKEALREEADFYTVTSNWSGARGALIISQEGRGRQIELEKADYKDYGYDPSPADDPEYQALLGSLEGDARDELLAFMKTH